MPQPLFRGKPAGTTHPAWNRKAIAECESRYEAYKTGEMGSVDALDAIAALRTRFVK